MPGGVGSLIPRSGRDYMGKSLSLGFGRGGGQLIETLRPCRQGFQRRGQRVTTHFIGPFVCNVVSCFDARAYTAPMRLETMYNTPYRLAGELAKPRIFFPRLACFHYAVVRQNPGAKSASTYGTSPSASINSAHRSPTACSTSSPELRIDHSITDKSIVSCISSASHALSSCSCPSVFGINH